MLVEPYRYIISIQNHDFHAYTSQFQGSHSRSQSAVLLFQIRTLVHIYFASMGIATADKTPLLLNVLIFPPPYHLSISRANTQRSEMGRCFP